MQLNKFLAAAALAALAAPAFAPAFAQEAAAPAAGMTSDHVAAADADKDGKISQAEYQEFMEVTFVTLDVNKDGFLEWSEVSEIIPLNVFESADTDNNNALSRAEFTSQVMSDFSAADRDGDGALN